MKSTIFREILNEEFIEVNKSIHETIQCLYEQSGACYISKIDGIKMFFHCSKKGKISMESSFYRREGLFPIYSVYGNVVSKNNKTYVRIFSVYKKSNVWIRSILLFLLIPIFILKIYLDKIFYFPAILISLMVILIGIIDFIKTTSIRKNRGLEIIKIMENEIKKRVKNIERWNN